MSESALIWAFEVRNTLTMSLSSDDDKQGENLIDVERPYYESGSG